MDRESNNNNTPGGNQSTSVIKDTTTGLSDSGASRQSRNQRMSETSGKLPAKKKRL